MNRLMVLGILVWMGIALHAQSLYPDFSKLNFGCDGNSITAGEQWSKTVVDKLGFATHHNVAVGSATWACHPDTQDYGSEAFAGIFGVKAEFAQFFGGTSLLILVGVVLDTLQQVESHLLMRHYDGLLKSGRIKGRTGSSVAAY